MKNLVKMLKSSFVGRMVFVATVFVVALASTSCKHDGGNDKKEEVTLTFVKGQNVTKVEHASVKVAKNSSLKPSDLLAKIGKIDYTTGYEFSKLCIGAEAGVQITDAKPFVAKQNTNIYVVAKIIGSGPQPGDVVLTSVMVGTVSVPVADEMDAGSVVGAEVDVEFETHPNDATLSFDPALSSYDPGTKKGKLALELGKKTLKIKVKKDATEKEYTLKLERVNEDAPRLTSLKVDGNSITPIADEMTANNTDKEKVKVEYESAPQGSTVTTTPLLQAGEWALQDGDNILKIKVKKDATEKEYKLKITKNVAPSPDGKPKLTSITVGPHKKDVKGIIEEDDGTIEIPVPLDWDGIEYNVEWTVDVEGAEVTFDPALETGNKIKFDEIKNPTDLEKEFNVTVSKDGKVSKYNIKAIMMSHGLGIFAGRYKGVDSTATPSTLNRILRQNKNVNLTMYGDKATIIIVSQVYPWKTVRINNTDCLIPQAPNARFKGYGKIDVPLELGKEKEVEVMVSNSKWDEDKGGLQNPNLATEIFRFKITSPTEKADAFISRVRVNKIDITDERNDDDAFTNLFDDTSTPEIKCDGKATILVELSKKVKKVKIGDVEVKEEELTEGIDIHAFNIWKAEVKDVDVPLGSPKLIEVVVTPKDEDTSYRETTMKFNLVNTGPAPLLPSRYNINGVGYYDIPEDFRDGLQEKTNPAYKVNINKLNLKLVFRSEPKKVSMTIGDTTQTFEGEEKIKKVVSYGSFIWEVLVSGDVATSEKQVTLTFEPKDTTKFSNGEYKFKIIGTIDKPKLSPEFYEISKDKGLPKKTFLERLTDGSKPTHNVKGEQAELVIRLPEYQREFFLDTIKVDGAGVTADEFKFVKGYFGGTNFWVLKKTIDLTNGLTDGKKDVKIEFIAKAEGGADPVTWEFKLEKTDTAPKVPVAFIRLGVNEQGEDGIPFKADIKDALMNGEMPPVIETYGKNIEIRLRTRVEEYLKEVKLKLGSGEEVTEQRKLFGGGDVGIDHTFENVAINTDHEITLTIVPDTEDFSPVEMKFKVKSIDALPSPKYNFFINGDLRPSGYKAKLDQDFTKLIFQIIEDDVVEKVEIGKEAAPENAEITSFYNASDKKVYQAIKLVEIDTAQESVYVIKVTPKDTSQYATVTCKYHLQGTAVAEDNASFILRPNGNPDVRITTTFKEGIDGVYSDDYGAISALVTAQTMSKESIVKVIKVDPVTGQEISGESASDLTRTVGTREVKGTVVPYEDKPTRFKLYVTGKLGGIDNKNGVYNFDLNPVQLFWSYKKVKNIKEAESAYTEIKVSKAKVKKNKIAIFVASWKDEDGFKVSDEPVAKGQSGFEKIGPFGRFQDLYRVLFDVEEMEPNTSKDIVCKIVQKSNNKEALSYKIKVTMEP